ncbi:MAG: imidazoleglycerol-phosphate dehydratase [Peptococcaceae bacterium]|nr:imidazoleglycerol-phosphate dehydratase [Peptococcaceae bacterium]
MRRAQCTRETRETCISVQLNLDGTGLAQVDTGIGFFDHMLDSWARFACFDLELKAEGDLHVDAHHTVEDCGIVLGQVLKEALGDKGGIERVGDALFPMDEALAQVAVDISGRGYLAWGDNIVQSTHAQLKDITCTVHLEEDQAGQPSLGERDYLVSAGKTGIFPFELAEEFFRALACNAGITLHVRLLAGKNSHHVLEAVFKGVGRALRLAGSVSGRYSGAPSTKGSL